MWELEGRLLTAVLEDVLSMNTDVGLEHVHYTLSEGKRNNEINQQVFNTHQGQALSRVMVPVL